MATMTEINHVALIVDDIEKATKFYVEEFNLERIPAFDFDYPTEFLKINDKQQIHLTEWEDAYSFRGHACFVVDDFNAIFWRMKELGCIDIQPWGKVRWLPNGGMQMFIRDPSGNLIEISCLPSFKDKIDSKILADEFYQEGVYKSGRNDGRGMRGDNASLYHSMVDDNKSE